MCYFSVDLCSSNSNGECSNGVVGKLHLSLVIMHMHVLAIIIVSKLKGFAPVGGMCSQSWSCTINENSGFNTAFILAHETGHK